MTGKAELANTEQLGRLIKLCANAIELTQDNKRDPRHVYEAIKALQNLKDRSSHICSCGYPHYKRSNWGGSQSYLNNAIKQICQFLPGESIDVHHHSDNLYTAIVVSAPYFDIKRHHWIVELVYPASMSRRVDSRIIKGEFSLEIGGLYLVSNENWFSFTLETREIHSCNHQ